MESTTQTTTTAPETFTPQQALNVLVQAVHFGQSKGIYSVSDAALLDRAIKTFTPAPTAETAPENVPTVESEDEVVPTTAVPA